MANNNRLLDASGRSESDAIRNIFLRTQKENTAKPVILADLSQRFPHKKFRIEDNGVDNSGAFISDAAKVTLAPDWLIYSDDKQIPTEVLVHSEKYSTCSNKVCKLKYSVQHQTLTAIIRENYWLVIPHLGAQWLLDNMPEQSNPRIFGGKPSIILDNDTLQGLCKDGTIIRYDYMPKALDAIQNLRRQLFN